MANPIIHGAGEGEKRAFLGGGLHTWKLRSADTDGAFFLFEDVMVRGKCTPLHCHPDADETTYLLAGEIVLVVDGKESRLTAGATSFVPRATPHAFLVVSDEARLLALQTPGAGEAFYIGASEPTTADVSDAVDLARLQQSAAENIGVTLLGPPPFAAADAH